MDTNTFINEALIELYDNYTPQYDNLYKVEIFSNSSTTSIKGINLSNYISFHTTKVSFNGESLSLDRDNVTKNFKLKSSDSFSRTDTLSLTWRECDTWKVKRYHDNWIGLIYDRQKDCYKSFGLSPSESAKNRLYRKIRISFPDTSNSSMEEDNYIEFSEVLPNTSGGIELGFNTTSNIISHTLNYYVTDWRFSWDMEDTNTTEDTFEPNRTSRLAREEERFESDSQGVIRDKRLSEDRNNKLSREENRFQEDTQKVAKSISDKNNLSRLSREEERFESDSQKVTRNKRLSEDRNNKLLREENRFQEDFKDVNKTTKKSNNGSIPFEYSPTRNKLNQSTSPTESSNKLVISSNKKNNVNYEENSNSAIKNLQATQRGTTEKNTSKVKTRKDFNNDAEYQRYQLSRASEAGKSAGERIASEAFNEVKNSTSKTLNPFSSKSTQNNYSEFNINSKLPKTINNGVNLSQSKKDNTSLKSFKYSPTRETLSQYTKHQDLMPKTISKSQVIKK